MVRLLALLLCLPALALADNRLLNGGFEYGYEQSGQADAWSATGGNGFEAGRTTDGPHSGRFAMRLAVAPTAPVGWYQVSQEISAPSGTPLTASAWVRVRDVADGAGAYLSINFFNGTGTRIGYTDSPALKGTAGYTRQTVTATSPPGASTLRVILLVHGHGEAVFDDVQLEAGTVATPWQPSAADRERAERLERQRQAADELLKASGYRRVPGRNVALLAEALPSTGTPTRPADLTAALAPAGYQVTPLTADQLANEALLDPATFDLLVLPDGDAFPAAAQAALVHYLARGGCFLSLGGYAFDRPLVKVDGKWYPPDQLPTVAPTVQASVDEFSTARPIVPASGDHGLDVGVRPAPGADGNALRLATPAMHQWATWALPVDTARLPANWSVTRLRVKADREHTHLIVEWTEQDKSRWQKVLDVGTQWQEFAIPAHDLAYWHDNPSIGRGGRDDRLHPANAASMTFGFSIADEPEGSALGVDLDWIRVTDDPLAALRGATPWINTRYGEIRDAMHPHPDQIGAFDPSHPLLDVARAQAADDQTVLPPSCRLDGPLTGYAATCVLGVNGHGFSPNRCRLVPLLQTTDAQGRPRGAAMSLAYHYNGFFSRSAWGFCGVDNRDLFGRGQPLNAALPALADALVARVFLHEADAEFACYRPGETMTVRASVGDLGLQPVNGQVRLRVDGQAVPDQAVTLAAGATQAYEWRVPVPADRPFVALRFELVRDGKVVDALDNGVAVWRDEDVRRGPTLTADGAVMSFRGKHRFIVGSQTWWGQVASVTARSPLQFSRDFQQMKSLGFHITRDFLKMDTEQERRLSDMMVALAAAEDIVIFHTPNLSPTASAEDRQRWPAVAKLIAERYRGVPNVVVDLCNEPRLGPDLPDLLPGWRAWLQQRYGNVPLQQAWGPTAPAGTTAEAPLPEPKDSAVDAATYDLYHYLVVAHRAWWQPLSDAIHAVDPTRLVTVGYLPGSGWGPKALVAAYECGLGQDFTDRHFYGPVADFPTDNAFIDQRLRGVPSSIGEFGARNHPGFGNQYEDTETYNRRFESIVTHAFGMGDSFACSWHWRDPMEGIFPFGQVHADNVPRPVAAKMAAMAQAFGDLDRVATLPKTALLLPTDLLLSGARYRVVGGVRRAVDTLLGLHVPFAVTDPVSLRDVAPDRLQTIVAPLAYALPDETLAWLEAFVRRGGRLLLTGDPRYGTDRQPHPERLARLCGVTTGAPVTPLDVSGPGTPGGGNGLPAWTAHPAAPVTAAGATALTPVIFEHRLDAGRVIYVAAPLEAEPVATTPLREVYAPLLERLGTERLAVTPDVPELHVFRIDLAGGGRRYLVWNDGEARTVTVQDPAGPRTGSVGGHTWRLL